MIDTRTPIVYPTDIQRRKNMQATLSKWGNSQGVRLPKELFATIDIKIGDTVEIETDGDAIIIKKAKKKKHISLKERLKDYEGKPPEVYDWGKPMGNEVW